MGLPAMGGMGPFVYDAASALRVPSVGRATAIYGMIRQAALDAYRGSDPLPRPRLLDRPDPTRGRAWFVGVQIEDYLWHGNALQLITDRLENGFPKSVSWLPAAWVGLDWSPGMPRPRYMVGERELPYDDVIHVRRGADRRLPWRGIGVIEQYLLTLDRAAAEEDYERNSLNSSGVPSVAVVTPNPALSTGEAEDGKEIWMQKFGGPIREPAFLPYGTTIVPLGWSPADSQMVEARRMTLQDVANAFNLDGYWLGAEAKGMTYRSPAPLYTALLRTSLEPVMADLEEGWSDSWLPRGQIARFDRLQLTRDDFASAVPTLDQAAKGGIISITEARRYLGLPADPDGALTTTSPIDTEAPPEPEPEPEPEQPPEEAA